MKFSILAVAFMFALPCIDWMLDVLSRRWPALHRCGLLRRVGETEDGAE